MSSLDNHEASVTISDKEVPPIPDCDKGCEHVPFQHKCQACQDAINASEDAREAHKDAMAASDYDPVRDGPLPGTYAYTARCLVEMGIMDGDEADRWKDEMKERDMDEG